MANPIQQGLKLSGAVGYIAEFHAAMANPIQQGLKLSILETTQPITAQPQWLIQYNKD